MIKTILVPTTGTAADDACFPAAAALARRLAAHLDFLHVRQDAAEILAALSDAGAFPFPNRLVDDLERTEAAREAAAKRKVEQFRAADGAPLAAWNSEVGNRGDWVVRYGQASDLLLVGRPAPDQAGATELLETALIESGRPLYIPGPAAKDWDTVVIAWKPTRESARAVTAAAPLLALASRVVVLTVEEGAPANVDSAARLVATLRRRGLAAERHHVLPEGQSLPDRLLTQAVGLDAGLLVMGGYGHSRMREWVFGGFTQRMLAAAPLPVLMCH